MKVSSTKLNIYERIFYFCIWISAIIYSIYNVYLSHIFFENYIDLYSDFSSGWSWVRRKQDISDLEWKTWIPLMTKVTPWVVVHHFISYIIKINYNSTVLCCWYIFMSTAFLSYYLGIVGTIFTILQPCLLHFLVKKNSVISVWLVHLLFLFFIHFLKIPDGLFQHQLDFTDEEHYIIILTSCWTLLRSISQSIDSIEVQHTTKETRYASDKQIPNKFLLRVAYCLYLPTLFLGPLVLYSEFESAICRFHSQWDVPKVKRLALNFIKCVFWLYFTEFSMHFLYFNALRYHPEFFFQRTIISSMSLINVLHPNSEFDVLYIYVVQSLNPWALYGLGYCMGQYFLNKYVVVYGINGSLCEMDGIKSPPKPKCIARIHLYSDMWKYFDRGLYNFLIRYIYVPILGLNLKLCKLLASFSCFTFIFMWHGMELYIFIWSLLNFMGVVVENVARSIGKKKIYYEIVQKYLSQQNTRRFHCAIASPLLAMSALSNFYFFAGQEIGNIFVYRILHDSWNTKLLLLFILYCCCNASTDIKKWEKG